MKSIVAKVVSLATLMACVLSPAQAQEAEHAGKPFSLKVVYKADVMGVASGGVRHGARFLDNVDVIADADLDRAMSLRRTTAHVSLLNNLGGRPNDLAGSIQGINNIEVVSRRLKLYEAWLEKGLGRHVTVKTGLYDVNSEFYQNDAAGLLISPMFGIGSELAATGANGPAIFPSTSLAARLRVANERAYAAFAVVNAQAGTIGDVGGVDWSGRYGALLIGEAGLTGRGKLAIGGWRYTRKQPAIIPPGLTRGEDHQFSHGAYLLAERDLLGMADGTGRHLVAFARLGVSDGRTTPFRGGWQSGLLLERPFATRPAAAFSLGVGNGALSTSYRMRNPVALPPLDGSETIVELTYRDEVVKGVFVQPDLQYVVNPAANSMIDDAIVLGMRITIDWSN